MKEEETIYDTFTKEMAKVDAMIDEVIDTPCYQKIAKSMADLVTLKQEKYGDSFGKTKLLFEILYPDGIKKEQYKDILAIVRILDKINRIATDETALGEDPWKDINGYSLLMIKLNEENK